VVVTVITVLSSLGYWRIGSVVSARSPTSRMSRLTTSESTGRRMKMSVKATRRSALFDWAQLTGTAAGVASASALVSVTAGPSGAGPVAWPPAGAGGGAAVSSVTTKTESP